MNTDRDELAAVATELTSCETYRQARDVLDAFLAAHDRAVAQQALRDAADAVAALHKHEPDEGCDLDPAVTVLHRRAGETR